jgi:hypothetical protein
MKKLEIPKIKQGIYLSPKSYEKLRDTKYLNSKKGINLTYSIIIDDLIEKHI